MFRVSSISGSPSQPDRLKKQRKPVSSLFLLHIPPLYPWGVLDSSSPLTELRNLGFKACDVSEISEDLVRQARNACYFTAFVMPSVAPCFNSVSWISNSILAIVPQVNLIMVPDLSAVCISRQTKLDTFSAVCGRA